MRYKIIIKWRDNSVEVREYSLECTMNADLKKIMEENKFLLLTKTIEEDER